MGSAGHLNGSGRLSLLLAASALPLLVEERNEHRDSRESQDDNKYNNRSHFVLSQGKLLRLKAASLTGFDAQQKYWFARASPLGTKPPEVRSR